MCGRPCQKVWWRNHKDLCQVLVGPSLGPRGATPPTSDTDTDTSVEGNPLFGPDADFAEIVFAFLCPIDVGMLSAAATCFLRVGRPARRCLNGASMHSMVDTLCTVDIPSVRCGIYVTARHFFRGASEGIGIDHCGGSEVMIHATPENVRARFETPPPPSTGWRGTGSTCACSDAGADALLLVRRA